MSRKDYNKEIIETVLKAESHVRALAKQLRVSQTTVARTAIKLSKENIVDFRMQGKNKVIFIKKTLEAKQFVYAVESRKIIDLLKKYPLLRRNIELIKSNKNIRLAVLFGSYVKGNATKDSDIDIYIDTENRKIKEQVGLIDSKINVKIGSYDKNSLLIKEIEKNHIILKGVEEYYEKNKFFE